VNPGFEGFYRTAYERGVVGGLLERQHAALTPGERIMLLDAEWASFRAGDRPVGELLASAESVLSREGSAAVLSQVAMQLSSIQESIADDSEIAPFRRWVAEAARAGGDRANDGATDEAQRQLASELAWIGGVIGDDPELRARAVVFAKEYLRDPWSDRNANPDVMLAIAGRSGDAALYDALSTRLRKTKSEQERYRIAAALGSFREPEFVGRTLRMTVEGTLRSQDAANMIARLLSRRDTSGQAWDFVRSEWPKLKENLPPGFTGDRIVRAAGSFCDAARRAEVERFFLSPEAPATPHALASSLASIDACVALRERHRGELGAWLSTGKSGR